MTQLPSEAQVSSEDERVLRLHHEATIVNGLSSLTRPPTRAQQAFAVPSLMHEGGVTAVNYTVAVDEDFRTTVKSLSALLDAIDASGSPRALVATSTDEVRAAKQNGLAAIILGFQGAEPIEGSLEYLDIFHRLGLRILQLTYQRRNLVGDGCGEPADGKLSVYGREVVKECNRLGILIDLSHTGYRSTMEAIEISEAPVAFTHVNPHTLNPLARNKTDESIKFLAERGGVVGINAIARLLSPHGRERGATIEEFLDQIEYVADLIGVEHVGIGLDVVEDMTVEDFELRKKTFLTQFPELSAGGEFPFEYYYVTGLRMGTVRLLTEGLVRRGFDDQAVLQVLGENFMRVFDEAWHGSAVSVKP